MTTVAELMATDWWGPCLPEDSLEAAWSLGSKDLRAPRLCSAEPTRDPEVLADLIGRPATPLELQGAAYAYCRAEQIEGCHFAVPPSVPLPSSAPALVLALAALAIFLKRAKQKET